MSLDDRRRQLERRLAADPDDLAAAQQLAALATQGALRFDGRTLSEWILELSATSEATRINAAHTLANLKAAAWDALPALLGALADPSEDLRLAASAAIQSIRPQLRGEVFNLCRDLIDLHTRLLGLSQDLRYEVDIHNERGRALRRLTALGPQAREAAPILARTLFDDRPDIREGSRLALAAIGADATPVLLRHLQHPDLTVRRRIARALGALGPAGAAATPALTQLLNSEDGFLTLFAAESLWLISLQPQPSLLALSQLLDTPNPRLRRRTLQLLCDIGPQLPPSPHLTNTLQALWHNSLPPRDKRLLACTLACCNAHNPEIEELLIAELYGPRERALPALRALANCSASNSEAALNAIQTLLPRWRFGNHSPDDLALAYASLPNILGPRALTLLINGLQLHHLEPAWTSAATSLLNLGPPGLNALQIDLRERLQAPENPQLHRLLNSLSDLGPRSAELIASLLDEARDERLQLPQALRRTLLHTLARLRDNGAAAAPTLIREALAASQIDWEDTRATLAAIAPSALHTLQDALSSPDPLLRLRLLEALGLTDDTAAIPLLNQALSDDDPDCRHLAAEGLARLGAIPELQDTLQHGPTHTATNALLWLELLGPQAAPAFALAATHPDDTIPTFLLDRLERFEATPLRRASQPALQLLLNHHSPSLQARAARLLADLTPQLPQLPMLLANLATNDDVTVRRRATEALTRLEPLPISLLQDQLQDPDFGVRAHARRGLNLPTETT